MICPACGRVDAVVVVEYRVPVTVQVDALEPWEPTVLLWQDEISGPVRPPHCLDCGEPAPGVVGGAILARLETRPWPLWELHDESG